MTGSGARVPQPVRRGTSRPSRAVPVADDVAIETDAQVLLGSSKLTKLGA